MRYTTALLFFLFSLLIVVAGCGSSSKETKSGIGVVKAVDGGYVGTKTCLGCHDGSVASDKREFLKSGHPYKYTHTGGEVMSISTLPGLYDTAPFSNISTKTLNYLKVNDGKGNLAWSAINYVMGGFGWKIRWGIRDPNNEKTGYIWTGSKAQYNVRDGSWSAYNSGKDKTYECATCHNTNGIVSTPGYACYDDPGTKAQPARTEPWAKNPALNPEHPGGYLSSWTFDGVQCEACHGPGENHVKNSAKMGILTLKGGVEICAKCHIRSTNTASSAPNDECGGDSNEKYLTNGAVASGDWISHHEQYNELVGYNGDGVHASLKCTTCHDPHKRSIKVIDKVAALLGITDNDKSAEARGAIKLSCVSVGCHPNKNAKTPALQNAHQGLSCADCHMAEATKSATSKSGTWGRKGDVKTHIFRINPDGTSIIRTNADGKTIAQNYITVKYACGKCHDSAINPGTGTPLTEAEAINYAKGYHQQ